MSEDQLLARLNELAGTKTGAPLPDWLDAPNGWGEPISKLCRDAAAEIARLRAAIEQLRAVAGKASIDGISFAQIKANQASEMEGYGGVFWNSKDASHEQ